MARPKKQAIVIIATTRETEDGRLDLFSYIVNELNADRISAAVHAVSVERAEAFVKEV